jgi:hypothetical protein
MPRRNKRRNDPIPRLQEQRMADLRRVTVVGKCPTKKLRYPTKGEAEVGLALAQRKRARLGSAIAECRVYECDRCINVGSDGPGWHLTHKEAR